MPSSITLKEDPPDGLDEDERQKKILSVTIHPIVTGQLRQNAYIVENSCKEAIAIDPGADADGIAELIDQRELTLLAILNTHGHYDHVGAVKPLMQRYGVPFYLHGNDARMLRSANVIGHVFALGPKIEIPELTNPLEVCPPTFSLGGFDISWVHTPGHTPGGACILFHECLFTGDTLMRNVLGRTDLPGGDENDLKESLRRLAELPEDITIYPGHGRPALLSDVLEKLSVEAS